MEPSTINEQFTYITLALFGFYIVYEGLRGRYRGGRKTVKDWQLFGVSLAWLQFVERPMLVVCSYFTYRLLFPQLEGNYGWLQDISVATLVGLVLGFMLIDEFLHGAIHSFAHARRPANKLLAGIQRWYKGAHRLHHLNGGPDGKGQIGATQTIVVSWGWPFSLPNYWFGTFCLYLGLWEVWIWGTSLKSLWGIHNHSNLTYDMTLLKHPNPWISKTMYALCHVLVFPNQHHHHHSRSNNSGRNMQNFIALYDWLLWKKLVISTERPAVYGWRKTDPEEGSALYRFFHRPFMDKFLPRGMLNGRR